MPWIASEIVGFLRFFFERVLSGPIGRGFYNKGLEVIDYQAGKITDR